MFEEDRLKDVIGGERSEEKCLKKKDLKVRDEYQNKLTPAAVNTNCYICVLSEKLYTKIINT